MACSAPNSFSDALDGQALDDVDELAAAVVAAAGIALGVLVGQHRALGGQDGGAGVVLRGDHLQAVLLPARARPAIACQTSGSACSMGFMHFASSATSIAHADVTYSLTPRRGQPACRRRSSTALVDEPCQPQARAASTLAGRSSMNSALARPRHRRVRVHERRNARIGLAHTDLVRQDEGVEMAQRVGELLRGNARHAVALVLLSSTSR